MSSSVQVKEYKNVEEFNKDAQRVFKEGWEVQSQTERTQRPGCMRILLTGGMALVFPPKPTIVVTYRRVGGPSAKS